MTPAQTRTADSVALPEGIQGIVADWSSDQRAFKNVPWGKAMMWIFLLSDTFIFSCFLISYMTVRMSTTDPWPNPSEVFGLTLWGRSIPLLLIVATKVIRGDLDHERPGFLTGRKGKYEIVEIMGLYWHFVDLVWVFIFAVFYLW